MIVLAILFIIVGWIMSYIGWGFHLGLFVISWKSAYLLSGICILIKTYIDMIKKCKKNRMKNHAKIPRNLIEYIELLCEGGRFWILIIAFGLGAIKGYSDFSRMPWWGFRVLKTSLFFGMLIVLLIIAKVICKVNNHYKTAKQNKTRRESYTRQEEFCELCTIDYAYIATNRDIGTFKGVVENHYNIVFSEKNAKRYQELPDGTSSVWDRKKQEFKQLILILNNYEEISKYIDVAYEHFVKGRWEECCINLRKVIEWMILTKIDAEGTLFEGEKLPSIIELIENYYSNNSSMVSYMKGVHRNGNKAAHTFANDGDVVNSEDCIWNFSVLETILLVYFADAKIQRYLNTPVIDVGRYIGAIDELLVEEYYEDVAINIRKTIELLVRGYMSKYKVRCLCGYERNLHGYIELLHFQKCITEESKNNMHKLRSIANESAHMKTGKKHMTKENMQECFDILKQEVDKYEKF